MASAVINNDEAAALALQLEEIDVYLDNGEWKDPVDKPSDIRLACEAFQQDLTLRMTSLNDFKLAQSLSRATSSDIRLIEAIVQEEAQIYHDKQVALRLEGGGKEKVADPWFDAQLASISKDNDCREVVVTGLVGFTCDDTKEADNMQAGSSKTKTQGQIEAAPKASKCVVCVESFLPNDLFQSQCDHSYCQNCLKDLFIMATTDQTLYPPRCCKHPISFESIQQAMTAEETEAYHVAMIEFSTTNRTYCSNHQCGKFILPSNIKGDVAVCNVCCIVTCVHCKGAAGGRGFRPKQAGTGQACDAVVTK